MLFLLYSTSIFLFILTLFSFIVIYKRFYSYLPYSVIEIIPTKFSNNQILIDKMTFFISSLKSMPDLYWDYNVILDVTNKHNVSTFRILVPENYWDEITAVIKNNFPDFTINQSKIYQEEDFPNFYKGYFTFRTDQDTPLIKEEVYQDHKLIENVKTILNSVKMGSFQIMLDFSSKKEVFINEDEIKDVKIGNSLVSSNINFVKDIWVSFRYLSFDDDFSVTQLPSALWWILNLWWKTNILTKIYKNSEFKFNPTGLSNSIKDSWYRLFNWNDPKLRSFSPADLMYFSSKEISSMYCFVSWSNIKSINYKVYSPVKIINKQKELEQKYLAWEFTKIALFDFPWFENQYFKLHAEVLRRHTYIIWKTWTGKTTALKVFIKDDIEKNRWFALFDPNWDVAREILDFIPESRKDDVVFIDPSVYLGRVNLSIFSFLRELKKYQKLYENTIFKESKEINENTKLIPLELEDKLMSMIVRIVKDVSVWWWDHWWARMDNIMKNVWTELLKYDISEIQDMSSYLNNALFRKNVIANVSDPFIKDELMVFQNKDEKARDEAFQPVRNRFQIFLNKTLNWVFSWDPKLSLKEMMDSWKILIFRLPKGNLWEGANLIGSVMIWLFWALAQTRISIPEHERKDFTIYIDEVQNFITDSFSSILEEARKYRFRLVMANQFTKQIYDRNVQVYNSIIWNIWTFIALWIWQDDANTLSKYFWINTDDMVNIPPLHWYVKCPSYSDEAFSIKMEFIKQNSELKYPGYLSLMNLSHSKYWIDSDESSNIKHFSFYKETIYEYLIKSKNFNESIFLFDLSIDPIAWNTFLKILEMEDLIRNNSESYNINETNIRKKLEEIEKSWSLYYKFDYSINNIWEIVPVSLRTYFDTHKKMPEYNLIKPTFYADLKYGSIDIENIDSNQYHNEPFWNDGYEQVIDIESIEPEVSEDMLNKAINLCYEYKKCSLSILQTKLKIWYWNAQKIIDLLETRWIVWKANWNKPRDVLIINNKPVKKNKLLVDVPIEISEALDSDYHFFNKLLPNKRNDFDNFVFNGLKYFDINKKHPDLRITDRFFVYKIKEIDTWLTFSQFASNLWFCDFDYFLENIFADNLSKCNENTIVNKNSIWAEIVVSRK